MSVPSMELPRYRCHKEVWALKIAGIAMLPDGSATIEPADRRYASFRTKGYFPFKGSDDDLGYFVQYKDGYQSWSPSAAFEEGYTLIA